MNTIDVIAGLKRFTSERTNLMDVVANWSNNPSITGIYENFEYVRGDIIFWTGNKEGNVIPNSMMKFHLPEKCEAMKEVLEEEMYCEFVTENFYCAVHVYPL